MFCADFPPRLGLFLSSFVAKVFLSGRELKPASQPVSERHAQCRGRRPRRGDVDEKISLQNHFFQAWNSLSIPQKNFSEELSFFSKLLGNFMREFCSILSIL
jgi:hypothetical protein